MDSSADDDPILWAGAVQCATCGRAAFPVDAAWLGERLIIAEYGRPCGHHGAMAIVIDLSGLDVPPGARPAPAQDLSLYVPGRRCAGYNRFKLPCRAYADPGSDFCHAHSAAQATRDSA